ncbi:MAG: hypothetical protein HY674_20085 [Chloroflexi bacterium]|nr:hypothetical protein [Chloroflexota bacterium]
MKPVNFEAALKASPFRAFDIHADGKIISVTHPEQVFFAENKSTLVIDLTDRIEIVDVGLISSIGLKRRQRQPAS